MVNESALLIHFARQGVIMMNGYTQAFCEGQVKYGDMKAGTRKEPHKSHFLLKLGNYFHPSDYNFNPFTF